METINWEGIIGSALGVLGGVLGTYFSIRNTNGGRERRFMVQAAIAVWLGLVFIGVAVFLVPWFRAWSWVPICVLVVLGVPLLNRRLAVIKQDDARS